MAFAGLPPVVILNCVQHCEKLVTDLYEMLLANDDEAEECATSDTSGHSSDSDLDLIL